MIKRPITYTNYDGETVTKDFYFHLNQFEWTEIEAYTKGGLVANLKSALKTGNAKKIIDILKKIIIRAYGEKNPETGEFYKNDSMGIAFTRTEAFSALFCELAYNEKESEKFFSSLIPQEMKKKAEEMKKKAEETKNDTTIMPSIPSIT